MGKLSSALTDLLAVVERLPAAEWYVDDNRLMAVIGRGHNAIMVDGSDAYKGSPLEVMVQAPDGSDGGRGAHGDGDLKIIKLIAQVFATLTALKPLLSTPALAVLLGVLTERERQQSRTDEGGEAWDEAHDDAHMPHELAVAAAYYAMAASGHACFIDTGRPPQLEMQRMGTKGFASVTFPWDVQWFKPKDTLRNSEIAMALLVAHSEATKRSQRRNAAAALPDAPYEAMARVVLKAAGVDISLKGQLANAVSALKLHCVNP